MTHVSTPFGVPCEQKSLPLPPGEVSEQSEDGEGRHVKKICQWHIFSVDLSGYAAVASILVCTASSFSSDRGSYAAAASIRICTASSRLPSQSPTVTALPKGEPRVCAPLYRRIPRRHEAVRPYNRLPYPRLVLALSFRARDRRHWCGNPFSLSCQPAALGRHLPLPLRGKGAI